MLDKFALDMKARTLEARSDPRTSWEIISTALAERDEDRAWDTVVTLHFRGRGTCSTRPATWCRRLPAGADARCQHPRPARGPRSKLPGRVGAGPARDLGERA